MNNVNGLNFINENICICESHNLIQEMIYLKEKMNYILLLDIACIDNLKKQKPAKSRYQLVYILLNLENSQRIRVQVPVYENSVPSVVDIWPNAQWYERECMEMFNIVSDEWSHEKLLIHPEFHGHPLRKDYIQSQQGLLDEITYQFKPLKSSLLMEQYSRDEITIDHEYSFTRGGLKIFAEIDDEIIKRAKLSIGYTHRGFEKKCENLTFTQINSFIGKLNANGPLTSNICWCKTVEEFVDIKIPPKAMAIRMVFIELSRVVDHLFYLEELSEIVEAEITNGMAKYLRERVQYLIKSFNKESSIYSFINVGGVSSGPTYDWVFKVIDGLNHVLIDFEKMILTHEKSKIWKQLLDVCHISAHDAIKWGMTGPTLRASGINYDLRKISPFYFYNDIDFEAPIGTNGTCFDRYLVRIAEIKESFKIIYQLLNNLPEGEISYLNEDYHLELPAGEIYSCLENSNGELGFYLISDGSKYPYRLKMRTPTFSICQSVGEIIEELPLEDVPILINSLNLVPAEYDR